MKCWRQHWPRSVNCTFCSFVISIWLCRVFLGLEISIWLNPNRQSLGHVSYKEFQLDFYSRLRLCAHGKVFERFHLCFHAKTDANTKAGVTQTDLYRRFVSQCHCDTNRASCYTRRFAIALRNCIASFWLGLKNLQCNFLMRLQIDACIKNLQCNFLMRLQIDACNSLPCATQSQWHCDTNRRYKSVCVTPALTICCRSCS